MAAKPKVPAAPVPSEASSLTLASISAMNVDELRLALSEIHLERIRLTKRNAELEQELKNETALRMDIKEELEDELAEAREEADDARNDRMTTEGSLIEALSMLGISRTEFEMLLQRNDVEAIRARLRATR